jgi:hypothetical protein
MIAEGDLLCDGARHLQGHPTVIVLNYEFIQGYSKGLPKQ